LCPDDPNKIEPGVCGCGKTDVDSDSDGICDSEDACPGFDDTDTDLDGVPDECEMGPNHDDALYDGNGDGEADKDQPNVASLFANAGQDYVTFATNYEDCVFADMFNTLPDEGVLYPEPGDSEGNEVDFPFGLFSFRVDCTNAVLDPPGEVMVTFRMPDGTNKRGAITVNTYMKKDGIGDWYDFRRSDDGTGPGADFLDDEVFMYFVDNDFGDQDAAVNVILDPGAPAFVVGLPDPPTSGADSSNSSSSSNCFIATAAYGSYMEPHVMTLQRFRDSYLLTNKLGTTLVEAYYKYSPPMANYIAQHGGLRSAVRVGLTPLVGFSWLAINYGMMFALAMLFSMLTIIIGVAFFIVNKKS